LTALFLFKEKRGGEEKRNGDLFGGRGFRSSSARRKEKVENKSLLTV